MATITATGTGTGMVTAVQRKLLFLASSCLCGAAASSAWAENWQITPSVTVRETVTDNINLVERQRDSEWITDIAPGLNIVGTGDRVKLRFDYRMHNLYYAHDSSRNNRQNSLNAVGSLEAVDNWLFIDATAVIAQQNLSAFRGATNTSVDTNNSDNTTETRAYRLSPYIKGSLATFADYQLRYSVNRATNDQRDANDTQTRQWFGRLAGMTNYSKLGWSLDASKQKSDFSRGRDTQADLLRGVLTYHYDPQFRVLLIGGREANDYASLEKESRTIKGAGFEWAPTERTFFAASREKRFFGDSDSVTFTHRTAGTAWTFRQTKDVVTATDQISGSVGTYFDLLNSIFTSSIPDPVARAAYVNAFLNTLGISPTAQLQGGFLTTGVTLQKRRELSFALIGNRNTVTFAATHNDSEALSQGIGSGWFAGTDFANLSSVKQQGASINWSHKLTGLSTLTGSVSRLESKGKGGSTSVDTDEKLYSINFVTQLGPKTNAGVSARRTEVDGAVDYTENAVIGTISHRF